MEARKPARPPSAAGTRMEPPVSVPMAAEGEEQRMDAGYLLHWRRPSGEAGGVDRLEGVAEVVVLAGDSVG